MGEAITIKKKKKLTIKSKSTAKQATPESTDPVADDAPVITPENPGIVLPGITPQETAPASSANYTFYAILAFLAFSLFVGIIIIQWVEWTYLSPAFPHPLPTHGG